MNTFDPLEFEHCDVLAGTERLARALRADVANTSSIIEGDSWVQHVEIFSIDVWLESLWDSMLPDIQLMTPVQELAMVKNVVDASGLLPDHMISSSNVARQILKAVNLCNLYRIDSDSEQYFFKPEYVNFSRWNKLIEHECSIKKVALRSMLPDLVRKKISDSDLLDKDRSLVLVPGAKQITPAVNELLDDIRCMGITIHYRNIAGNDPEEVLIARPQTLHDEMKFAACWVNDILQKYIGVEAEAPRIGIALNDKFKDGQLFCQYMSEHCGNPADIISGEAWDVVGVQSLGDNPIMASASDIISLSLFANEAEKISRIIRCFTLYGAESEKGFRAKVDLKLRRDLGSKVSLKALLRLTQNRASGESSRLSVIVETMISELAENTANRYPSEWGEHFSRLLNISGWLSADNQSSSFIQVRSAFQRALLQFSTLDRQLGSINRARAVMWFREIVDTTQFQPKLPHIAPVMVMGWDDIIDEQFDHLMILGASDSSLPKDTVLNPFIPLELQEKSSIPASTSDSALSLAKEWVVMVKNASLQSVVFTCPLQDQHGSFQAVSSLISGNEMPVGYESLITARSGQLADELFDTSDVPIAMSQTDLNEVRGGTSIIKEFISSPFVAFARFRLGIKRFPEEVVGLTPREQGIAVHEVLERFWTETKTSNALNSMSDEQLTDAIDNAVSKTRAASISMSEVKFGRNLIELESLRLKGLVHEWLNKEKLRSEPFEVISIEQLFECDLYGLPLRLRVDRMDRIDTDHGDKNLVIDYKTGTAIMASKLNASNLEEPQLPIYALIAGKSVTSQLCVDGICLAQVVPEKPSYHVRSNWTNSVVPKRASGSDVCNVESWEGQKSAWSDVLNHSVLGFKASNIEAYPSVVGLASNDDLKGFFHSK